MKQPSCNRCRGGVRIAVIAALDDPRGFVERPWVCPCVKGDRIAAAKRLIPSSPDSKE